MNYSIYKEELLSCSGEAAKVRAELVASSSETIPAYDGIDGRTLAVGSVAIVPSESKLYILDTDLLWTDWSNGEKLEQPEEGREAGDV